MKLYHATYYANLESIFEYGLGAVQKKNWDFSIDDGVCFCDDMDTAISFCECAENVDEEVFNSGIVCLEVDNACLNESLLFLDPNVLVIDNEVGAVCYLYRGVIDGSHCKLCFNENEYHSSLEDKLESASRRCSINESSCFSKDVFAKE